MMTWILLRAAGIGAYVALWLSVAWGLVATTGIVKRRISKPAANAFHAFVATVGLTLLAVHIVLLVIDAYMPFAVLDVLIPMRSTFRPLALTAGVIAMYAVVIVMVSSWSRSKMSTRLWRTIHLLAVPAFVLALLHGVFAGTDTQRPWMIALYGTTGVLTFFLVIVRGLTADYRPPRPATPARAPRPDTARREPTPAA
jgi:methionine sulfoxide reductase heme-binding subunit